MESYIVSGGGNRNYHLEKGLPSQEAAYDLLDKDSTNLLPLQLAVVEGVAALQRSADGFLSSKRQGHHLGSDVFLHTGVSPFFVSFFETDLKQISDKYKYLR